MINYRIPLLLLILCTLGTSIYAQKRKRQLSKKKPINLENFDDKTAHFGFSLGFNSSDFLLEADVSTNDSLLGVESDPQLGFNLGIVTDLHMGKNFSLRFIPTLSFSQRNLEYTFRKGNTIKTTSYVKPIESTYIDFPLNIKFRSNRDGNFAAYMLAGGMYSYDLVSQEGVKNESFNLDELVVKSSKHTISYQIGVGFDFFLEYFKFSPEIKLSMGTNNNHIQDNTVFSDPLQYLKSRIFLFSLNFEG